MSEPQNEILVPLKLFSEISTTALATKNELDMVLLALQGLIAEVTALRAEVRSQRKFS